MATKRDIIDIDKGYKNLLKSTQLLKNATTDVGVLSSSPNPKGESINMAQLAVVHEFGTKINVTPKMRGWFLHNFGIALKTNVITIPSRPFMSQTFDREKQNVFKKMKNILIRLGDMVAKGKQITEQDVYREIGLLGEWAVTELKKTFESGNFAPLSPLTIENRKKGSGAQSPKPLLDTGRLRTSMTHRVDLKGGKK